MRKLTLLMAAAVTGCQSYQPSPLDLRAHGESWAARDPASPAVAAYAARLSAEPTAAAATRPATFDPSDGLTLPEARAVALFFNPRLRAARLKSRVPSVGAAEAGRWADPVLQVDAERIIEAVSHPWVVGGMLNLTLPLSGRLAVERDRALADAASSRAEAAIEEQRVLADLDTAWSDLRLADERVELTRSFLADLDVLTSQAERLRAAAELSPVEAGLFRVEQTRRRIDLSYLEARRTESALAVKGLLGLTPEAQVRLVPSLPTPPAGDADPPGLADPAARRRWAEAGHPRVRLARAQYAAAERTLELEVAKQYPDLTIGGGYGRDEGTRRVLGGLGIPIPVFNANRRAIAEARAARDAARAVAEAEYEDVVGQLARAEAALAAARGRREAIARDLAPLADEQLRAARNLGRLGSASGLVVFEVMTRAQAVRLDLLDAVAAEAAAVNQINALLRPAVGIEPPAAGTSTTGTPTAGTPSKETR
jgi:cobalt-zinc-cadmium efflux system outer membrane protein